jgi:hypothetical protein
MIKNKTNRLFIDLLTGGLDSENYTFNRSGVPVEFPRNMRMMMATEMTDVHGNWVRYSYDSGNKLTAMYANDSRRIELAAFGNRCRRQWLDYRS